MSLAKCDKCGVIIDTDVNPECYYQRIPNLDDYQELELDNPRCESCNENVYNQIKNKQP